MVNIREEFEDEQEAKTWMESYLNRFHPCGYGTSLSVYYDESKLKWVVHGSRGSSCD